MTSASGLRSDDTIWADSALAAHSTQDEKDAAAKSGASPSPLLMVQGCASPHTQTQSILCFIFLTILALLAVNLAAMLSLRVGSYLVFLVSF